MVDPQHVHFDILAADIGQPLHLLQHLGEQLLRAEDLMAAAEGFDARKDLV
ncbi:hypothetical protein D3C72_2452370 [compost metagenome]